MDDVTINPRWMTMLLLLGAMASTRPRNSIEQNNHEIMSAEMSAEGAA
jgi:hypothetical protein